MKSHRTGISGPHLPELSVLCCEGNGENIPAEELVANEIWGECCVYVAPPRPPILLARTALGKVCEYSVGFSLLLKKKVDQTRNK